MQIDRDGRFARQCAVGLWVGEREVNERAPPLAPDGRHKALQVELRIYRHDRFARPIQGATEPLDA